jgi:GNAT superfamily N-acetyltransferase
LLGCLPGDPDSAGDLCPRVSSPSQASHGDIGSAVDFAGQGHQIAEAFDVAGCDAAAVGGHDSAGEGAVVVVLHSGPGAPSSAVGCQGSLDRVRVAEARCGHRSALLDVAAGEHYLGTFVIRHNLPAELLAAGGHVGYHVVAPCRRQGHATRMLAAGLAECRRLGLHRVLLTCGADNEPSKKVILANGGQPDRTIGDELRYWIDIDA